MSKNPNNGNPSPRRGYDSARHTQEEDHLNRWPFAREIYRIAADGPRDWSVRIGVYGEWGSGKTSVLHFIESMASRDGHVTFPFNPWQFQNTDDLWRAFVEGLYSQIEERTEKKADGSLYRKIKTFLASKAAALPAARKSMQDAANVACETIVQDPIQKAAALASLEVASEVGLALLRKHLVFSQKDLAEFEAALGERRLIVTIDDLDRTEAQLVPEILFALKEIMDIPGMSFVCAFDPVVVGHVLSDAHPGFENGLKFLDKIIDYPRWLPIPTTKQFADLAVSDAKTLCPYVPAENLREAVELLPQNPRAIRQFIRLLDLLRPQIERHYPQEIHWPVLLAANVMKVNFPQIAQPILDDAKFWYDIYSAGIFEDKNEKERHETITKKIEEIVRAQNDSSKQAIAAELERCIKAIAKRLDAWRGIGPDTLQYQFRIAEVPCAVTWREFDHFISAIKSRPTTKNVTQWIEKHAKDSGHTGNQVFSEILGAALAFRVKSLGKAADETSARQMKSQLLQAADMLGLIRVFIDLGRNSETGFVLENKHIETLFDQISQYFHWRRTPANRSARKQEEKLVKELFYATPDSIDPWLDIIGLNDWHHRNEDRSPEWKALMSKLRSELQNRCAKWMIQQLSVQSEFLRNVIRHETHSYNYEQLFFDLNGPLWTKQRKLLVKAFKSKEPNLILRKNAYDLLSWLVWRAKQTGSDSGSAEAVLAQADFSKLLWNVCLAEPLNPRAVGSLREVHIFLTSNGIECKTPAWWDRIVKDLPPEKTS